MAHSIIDELVVTLSLDPRGFNTAQRQAIQQLRGFQQQANTTANQVQSGAGTRLQRFWQGLGRPAAQAQQNLTNLGAQSNRVGTQIAAGINQGSVSLSRMTTAALAAYGAIKTVQGAVGKLNDAIASGAQTGRMAGYTGVSPSYMSSIAIGANISANANLEQTQQTLFQLRQFAEAAKEGQLNENQAQFLGRLGALGIALDTTQDPETMQRQLLQQLHERLSKMTQPQAQFFGGQLGFSPEFTRALQQHAPRQLEQISKTYGVTAQQAEQFRKLQGAINEFNRSWDAFINQLVTDHPQLEAGIRGIADWITKMRESPETMSLVEAGLVTLITLIGTGLVAAFTSALVKANLLWASPLFKFLMMLRGGPLAFLAAMFGYTGSIPKDENALPGADPRVGEHFRGNARPGPTPPTDDRTWWQKFAPYGWGGKDRTDIGKTIPVPGTSGNYTPAQLRQFALAAGFSSDAATRMAAIAYSESKGDPNAVSKTGDYGLTQVNAAAHGEALAKSTLGNPAKAFAEAYRISRGGSDFTPWSDYKNKNYEQYVGAAGTPGGGKFSATSRVDLSKVNPALLATLQEASGSLPEGYRVEAYSGARTGGLPGSQHHGGGALDVRIIGPNGRAIENTGADTTGMYRSLAHFWYGALGKRDPSLLAKAGWGGEFETYPGSGVPDLMHYDLGGKRGRFNQGNWAYLDKPAPMNSTVANLVSGMNLVGSAKAASAGMNATTNNNSSLGIGDIHVHTQATDAAGIARDLKGEVTRTLDVTNSNYGLEY